MSGLLALLDDVAAIAKVAAASVDDVAGMAAKAGSKAAGVVIDDAAVEADLDAGDPAHLEEARVRGAIKTDFILSAEIMTIALAAIPGGAVWMEALTLAVVGVGITAAVYGAVALIVKMDDIGLHVAARSRTAVGRGFGIGLVKGMPKLMALLSAVGTLAMLWVGGAIILHGFEVLGWPAPYDWIHHAAGVVAHAAGGPVAGFLGWLVTAAFSGLFGLVLGLLLIPLATRVIAPLFGKGGH